MCLAALALPLAVSLLPAQTACRALGESTTPGAEFFAELSRQSILELVIAHTQAEDADAALDWIGEQAVPPTCP